MANKLNKELEGKAVVLNKEYRGEETDRVFECEDGFGCWPELRGTAITGRFIKTGQQSRINGYDIQKMAKGDLVAKARQEGAKYFIDKRKCIVENFDRFHKREGDTGELSILKDVKEVVIRMLRKL